MNLQDVNYFLYKIRKQKNYLFMHLKMMTPFTVTVLGREVDLELVVAYFPNQKKRLKTVLGCSDRDILFFFEVALCCLGYKGKLHQDAIQAGEKIVDLYNRSNMKRSR